MFENTLTLEIPKSFIKNGGAYIAVTGWWRDSTTNNTAQK